MEEYVELHARSAFSFLQGGSVPEEYIDACRKLEMPAMALLDRDGVYGIPRFHMATTRDTGKGRVLAHVGAEVTCTDGGGYPLLCTNRQGYQNLCRLITRMKLRMPKHPKPGQMAAATPDELREFSEGLICLTGDEHGPLAVALQRDEHAAHALPRAIEGYFWAQQCVRGIAAAWRPRAGSPQ